MPAINCGVRSLSVALLALLALWLVGILVASGRLTAIPHTRHSGARSLRYITENLGRQYSPHIISRFGNVSAACDTRGNLGPCSVLIQPVPGDNWLSDRWQAASDMGGTAIPGPHWVILTFPRLAVAQEIVLDWETAFAKDYCIDASRLAQGILRNCDILMKCLNDNIISAL